MKIYLASSFSLKSHIQWLHDKLIEEKFIIPDVWWNLDSKDEFISDNAWYNKTQTKAIADRHWKNISDCDVLVLVGNIFGVGEPATFKPVPYNGANVEVGYAIAKNIPVLSVGIISRSAMYIPINKHAHYPELLKSLKIIRGDTR